MFGANVGFLGVRETWEMRLVTRTESKTTTVDGGKIRAYRFEAKGLQTRVGFVLRGKREYQLLCQASSGDPDGACALLFSSFSAA